MMPGPVRNRLTKNERLCSKKMIELLFQSGSSLMAFPFRFQYILVDSQEEYPVNVLFSIPKKRFKRAVKRNLIRRRTKEAFRLNKQMLYDAIPEGKLLICAFIYVDNTIQPFDIIHKSVLKTFERYISKQGCA